MDLSGIRGIGGDWTGLEVTGVYWNGLEENKGDFFIPLTSRFIKFGPRRYHTVVGFYINTMKTCFLFKFSFLTKFFLNYKITTKQREAVD